jgi:hypothetical protein
VALRRLQLSAQNGCGASTPLSATTASTATASSAATRPTATGDEHASNVIVVQRVNVRGGEFSA